MSPAPTDEHRPVILFHKTNRFRDRRGHRRYEQRCVPDGDPLRYKHSFVGTVAKSVP